MSVRCDVAGKIKKIIPMRMKALYKVRRTKYDIRPLMEELDCGKNRMILIGTPIHKNMGDHLIALAEKQFLDKNYRDKRIIEIPQDVYRVYKRKINKRINSDDFIFISGGGWLGNVWEVDDQFARNLLCRFPNNFKLIFPQTLYFDKKRKNYNRVLKKWKSIIKNEYRFKICFREKNSYEVATSVLKIPLSRCLLLPDIGLIYEKDIEPQKREKIGIIFRDDTESIMNEEQRKEVLEHLWNLEFEKDVFSTISDSLVGVNMREKHISELLLRFSRCKYIVTDRLHAMVFSILTNTPCVIFDNLTHKVSGVYKTWLNNDNNVFLVRSMQQFKEALEKIDNCSNETCRDCHLIENYNELICSINADLEGSCVEHEV